MKYAYAAYADDPDARARIRQLVEDEEEDDLRLDGRVIEAENAVNKSHRGGILYLCIYCGAEVKRGSRHGPSYFMHIHPHNCDFPPGVS